MSSKTRYVPKQKKEVKYVSIFEFSGPPRIEKNSV